MSVIHLRHIKTALEREYGSTLDLSDVADRPQLERDAIQLQRALAAFVLTQLTEAEPAAAAAAVTDGFNDNGLDAIYLEPSDKTLYLVQAKWDADGSSAPDVAAVSKFIQGFRDLIDARFDRFNAKVQGQKASLLAALDDPQVKFQLVLTHTGQQHLGEQPKRLFADLLADLNDTSEVVDYTVLRQPEIYAFVVGQAEGAAVNFDVALQEWGTTQEPHTAFYGQVEAREIAGWWEEYGARLFAKNLRKFIGDSEVNESIRKTIVSEPENFWYYNNGITALCTEITKKPIGGGDRKIGQFRCEGVSVVNGAQTVGCIGTEFAKSPEGVQKARVPVRFISLENCPPDFSSRLTRAANTQNRIERRDFVSLDPEQARLRTELMLDGKQYALKTGDSDPSPGSGCSVTEATVALACAQGDSGLAVQAKREIGKLWEDIDRPPYRLIFNGSVSGVQLWRCVEILRVVDAELKGLQSSLAGRERLVAVHGNRLVLHLVFQGLPVGKFNDPCFDLTQSRVGATLRTRTLLSELTREIEQRFPASYIASLVKNAGKCKELCEAVLSRSLALAL